MINYTYNYLQNLQGWFVRVSDCEELVGVTHRRFGNLGETIMLHSTLLTVCNCLITVCFGTGENSSVAEVASTTFADIIEEILIVVICTPICTP